MKRIIILMALSLLLIPCFFGFAAGQTEQATESKEIELTYWGWGPHVDAVNNEIGPAFTKDHPNVRVKAISMGPWDLMDKFYVSIVTGKGAPDLSILVRRVIAKYLIPELLYDFTDFMGRYEGDFPESLVADVTSVDGRILAIPPDYGPGVIYYDKGLVDNLAIDVDQIQTWDDFYRLGVRISKANPDIYVHPLFYPGGSWGSNQWRLYAMSTGGNIYDSSDKVIRNNTKLKQVTEFYYKLHTDITVAKGKVNDPSIYDQLRNGNLLFWPGTSYREMEIAQQAPELEGKLYTFPWPLWSKDAPPLTGVWGGVALAVPKKGSNAETAARFAEFYAVNDVALTKLWYSTGGVPTYAPVREQLLRMTGQPTFSPNLMESLAARQTKPWNFVDWAQTEKILGDALDSMFAGKVSPPEAWQSVEDQLIKVLGR